MVLLDITMTTRQLHNGLLSSKRESKYLIIETLSTLEQETIEQG